MPEDKTKTRDAHSTADLAANTLEWLITAFILAFIFRAFVLEAFQIPTGSMADTLMGDHFRIRCSQCGYEYEYNFIPEYQKRYGTAAANGKFRLVPSPRCPNCGYYENTNTMVPESNGDRIIVFKCIYQFTNPKRWDVVVFKDPTNPTINYIKRLIALPGETVEIIDGDIYINGKIARKPPKVQQEMWMPVYLNDYQPVRPNEGRFNGHGWKIPFSNDHGSKWTLSRSSPTIFTLDSKPGQENTMFYDTGKGNDFRASYAYDDPRYYPNLPICSDIMMKFYTTSDGSGAQAGIGLSKYGILYKAYLDANGVMKIEKTDPAGKTIELAQKQTKLRLSKKPIQIKFANVDHLLVFNAADEKLVFDLGTGKDDAGVPRQIQPDAMVFGWGRLSVSHLAIYRDIHYLSTRPDTRQPVLRAGEGNPFTLGKNEFFMLGDNSPDSADSRLWAIDGIGNNGKKYRQGIVPRNYLVGKAFFVYWPSGFTLGRFRLAFIPNIQKMRLIQGGRN